MSNLTYGNDELALVPDEAFIIVNKGQRGLAKAIEDGGKIVILKSKEEAERILLCLQDEWAGRDLSKYGDCPFEIRRVLVFEVVSDVL